MKDMRINVPLLIGAGTHMAQVVRMARERINRIVD